MNHTLRRLGPLLLTLALPVAARATVYVPTTTADTTNGSCGAVCSLRDAITAANQHAGADVILLHAGTYVLGGTPPTTGNLEIDGDLTLIGDGAAGTIIDGGGVGSIFYVPDGATATIQNVTLRNGRSPGAGGAVRNNGHLTLQRAVLTANSSVAGSAGAGFGGAILSDGLDSLLTLTDSTVSTNSAQGGGGGVAIGGDFVLANVTLYGNLSATDFGGGLYFFSDARGTANNLTVSGNSASLKGGGVFIETSAFIGIAPKITNSILAGNTASSDPDCSGAFSSGYDLIGNAGGATTGCLGPAAAKHDVVGTSASPIAPKLALLGNNGGPTPTSALLAGSPALDAGSPAAPGSGNGACEAADQRGTPRPGGVRCDIGAFEATSACVAGGANLCLSNGRFRVAATFQAPNNGPSGNAQGVTLTPDSGYFWFFDPGNVELTVKVLNGCALNNHYWVYAAGLTNVNVVLTVTDTQTGQVKSYLNPQGKTYVTILDGNAFATCPYVGG
jgi:CSLREA domain-containing protein